MKKTHSEGDFLGHRSMLTTQNEKDFRIKTYYFTDTTTCLTKQPRLQVSSVVSEWEK